MRQPAHYSLDNGISQTAFAEGEFYSVPNYAATAMIARGWARAANKDEAPTEDDPPFDPDPPRGKEEMDRRPSGDEGARSISALSVQATAPKIETTTYKMKLGKGKSNAS